MREEFKSGNILLLEAVWLDRVGISNVRVDGAS